MKAGIDLTGSYMPYRPLTFLEQSIFEKALNGFVGASYMPYAVSTQLVNGTNYHFLCTRTLMTLDPIESIVIVAVHCSLKGEVSRQDDIELIAK
jgi:hypothetical protein